MKESNLPIRFRKPESAIPQMGQTDVVRVPSLWFCWELEPVKGVEPF